MNLQKYSPISSINLHDSAGKW